MPARLVDRAPVVPPGELVAALVPPQRFRDVRFSTYVPDPAQPSQAAAVRALVTFEGGFDDRASGGRALLRRRRSAPDGPAGVYLDGGFGTGKTHLLASLWHEAPEPKSYGTFVELTSLVGALGFAATADALSDRRLLCVDEFELDDPGDTVLVSTLLGRLVDAGVRLAATSNTQPEDLGAGRFASDAFLREIQGLAATFAVVRVDGEDYRQRGLPHAAQPPGDDEVTARVAAVPGATEDDFASLAAHLATLHPSRYGALVEGLPLVGLHGVAPVSDQDVALRLVVLVDRLYDRAVPVVASGVPLDRLFPADLLRGPYRKKYSRAVSRLVSLAGGS